MENISSDSADGVGGFINVIANVLPPRISATQNSITSLSFSQRYGEMIGETVTISQKIGVKFEDSDFVALISEPKITYVPVKVEGCFESR